MSVACRINRLKQMQERHKDDPDMVAIIQERIDKLHEKL